MFRVRTVGTRVEMNISTQATRSSEGEKPRNLTDTWLVRSRFTTGETEYIAKKRHK